MATSKPSYISRLSHMIDDTGTSLCVGCDPHVDRLPPFMSDAISRDGALLFLEPFTRTLIDASVGLAPVIKFQSAFYEAFGASGYRVLENMVSYARSRGLLTILDAKRGDISSTMSAYGRMAFETLGADALTVTPYMGLDTVEPLIPWLRKGHGIYLVWISSNPSGGLIQDTVVAETAEPLSCLLFNVFHDFFAKNSLLDAFGLVLGATRVAAIPDSILDRLKEVALLMPGIGAQGGEITPTISRLLAGGKSLIPQSRALSACPDEVGSWGDYFDLVRDRIKKAASEAAFTV